MTLLPYLRHVKGEQKGMLRISRFLFIFNLRQGAILIAIQHIALSACALLLQLVGIGHAQEMMEMLNADMEDNAEREREEQPLLPNTNNHLKFQEAQALAFTMVVMLYACVVCTSIYLVVSVCLLYGSTQRRRRYVLPWLLASCLALPPLLGALLLGDSSPILTQICGGRTPYRFGATVVLLSHMYCILAVGSFMYELSHSNVPPSDSSIKLHLDLSDNNCLISHHHTLHTGVKV